MRFEALSVGNRRLAAYDCHRLNAAMLPLYARLVTREQTLHTRTSCCAQHLHSKRVCVQQLCISVFVTVCYFTTVVEGL